MWRRRAAVMRACAATAFGVRAVRGASGDVGAALPVAWAWGGGRQLDRAQRRRSRAAVFAGKFPPCDQGQQSVVDLQFHFLPVLLSLIALEAQHRRRVRRVLRVCAMSVLEQTRVLHEELEVLERAMMQELGDPSNARLKRVDEIARDQVLRSLGTGWSEYGKAEVQNSVTTNC
eukprot:6211529-Pleurochrysis_carterae.AAC.1